MVSEEFMILDGELISYSGSGRDVTVPDGVRVINEGAFLGCTNMESLILPEGVEQISQKAFWGCVGLRRISLPKSLRKIGLCAFRECGSLEEIDVPEGVTEMGDAVFRGCEGLIRVTLPDSLAEMGTSTFSDCFYLKEVRLPVGLERVGVSAFQGCISLTEIHIPDGVRTLDTRAFLGCSSLRRVRLPEGLREIERRCFEGCRSLMELKVPDSVTFIGANAFYQSGLMNDCPDDYLVLGRILVKYMGSGEEAVVPDVVRCVGDHAFAYSDGLKRVVLPDTAIEVQDYAFERCRALESVSLPDGLQRLGKGVFTDCKCLARVELPPNIDHIGADIFYGTAFEAENREETIVLGGKYLISYRGTAEKPEIPDGVEVIADEAFVRCSGLKEIVLPYGVRTIGDGAFRWRGELKKVLIPSTVNYIGENAFGNCHEPEITIMNPCGVLGENGIPDGTRLRVVVSSRVLKIKLTWEVKAGDCPERRLWNFLCVRSAATFSVLQKPEYKLSCAICFYDDGQWYRDYVKKNIVDAVCFAAMQEDGSLLERALSFGLLNREQLQACVAFAIEHKLTQQQIVLMRYGHESFGGDPAADRFSL